MWFVPLWSDFRRSLFSFSWQLEVANHLSELRHYWRIDSYLSVWNSWRVYDVWCVVGMQWRIYTFININNGIIWFEGRKFTHVHWNRVEDIFELLWEKMYMIWEKKKFSMLLTLCVRCLSTSGRQPFFLFFNFLFFFSKCMCHFALFSNFTIMPLSPTWEKRKLK